MQKGLPSFEQSLTQQAEAKRKRRRPEAKQTDRQQISPASSAAGIATTASDFPVIPDPDAALVSPPRVQLHSLSRLTDATDKSCVDIY